MNLPPYGPQVNAANRFLAMSCYSNVANSQVLHPNRSGNFPVNIGHFNQVLQAGALSSIGSDPGLFNEILKRRHQGPASRFSAHQVNPQLSLNREGKNGYSSMTSIDSNKRSINHQQRTICWEDRLRMLVAFKNEHGHCMVPQSHPHLGAWVKWQREKYALFEDGKTSYFTPEKIERLNKLGFVWRVRRKRKKHTPSNKTRTIPQTKESKQDNENKTETKSVTPTDEKLEDRNRLKRQKVEQKADNPTKDPDA